MYNSIIILGSLVFRSRHWLPEDSPSTIILPAAPRDTNIKKYFLRNQKLINVKMSRVFVCVSFFVNKFDSFFVTIVESFWPLLFGMFSLEDFIEQLFFEFKAAEK
uniref:Uncharacterized protein n=1 Tax=Caenorhabditis tropicalis TaxID=1561998 RepID=A0A1I7TZJ7_9PELO